MFQGDCYLFRYREVNFSCHKARNFQWYKASFTLTCPELCFTAHKTPIVHISIMGLLVCLTKQRRGAALPNTHHQGQWTDALISILEFRSLSELARQIVPQLRTVTYHQTPTQVKASCRSILIVPEPGELSCIEAN